MFCYEDPWNFGKVTKRYPGHLILKSILELNGYELRHAVNPALIVASPPCQEFSYMAMPWKRGKQIARGIRPPSSEVSPQQSLWEQEDEEVREARQVSAALRGKAEFPEGYTGSRTISELTALYRACFRIARECGCPIVLENVKGAQPWVGRAQANFGSYYLWGDIANVGGRVVRPDRIAFGCAAVKAAGRKSQLKVSGMNFHEYEKTGQPGRSFQSAAVAHVKVPSENGRRTYVGNGVRFTSRDCGIEGEGVKQRGSGREWFAGEGTIGRTTSSNSPARKAASAMIAEIPFDLAQHVAQVFKPI